MSGVEIVVPVAVALADMLRRFGIGLLGAGTDAQSFLMIASNVEDDIIDGYVFHRKLMRHVGHEHILKQRALVAIRKTEDALEKFRERIEFEGRRGGLNFVLSDRRAAKSLLQPLQAAQSSLSRRIDWMRSALEKLADSADEEGELPSSMAPGVKSD